MDTDEKSLKIDVFKKQKMRVVVCVLSMHKALGFPSVYTHMIRKKLINKRNGERRGSVFTDLVFSSFFISNT